MSILTGARVGRPGHDCTVLSVTGKLRVGLLQGTARDGHPIRRPQHIPGRIHTLGEDVELTVSQIAPGDDHSPRIVGNHLRFHLRIEGGIDGDPVFRPSDDAILVDALDVDAVEILCFPLVGPADEGPSLPVTDHLLVLLVVPRPADRCVLRRVGAPLALGDHDRDEYEDGCEKTQLR